MKTFTYYIADQDEFTVEMALDALRVTYQEIRTGNTDHKLPYISSLYVNILAMDNIGHRIAKTQAIHEVLNTLGITVFRAKHPDITIMDATGELFENQLRKAIEI